MSKTYLANAIVKDPGFYAPVRYWYPKHDADSLAKAMAAINGYRNGYKGSVYMAWIDEVDTDSGEKTEVYKEVFVDDKGNQKGN